MKIQYRKFKGPAMIVMGDEENHGRKNKTDGSIFLARFLSPIEGPTMIVMGEEGVCGWLGDENCDRKNRTDVFDFFGRDFRHLISPINSFENLKFSKMMDKYTISQIRGSCDCNPQSQSHDPRIHDIVFSSNIFENLKFFKKFDEYAMSRIRESCNCDGGGSG